METSAELGKRGYEFTEHVRSFWVIWSPGHGEPNMAYQTCQQAREVAHELAKEHPGQRFIVLKSDAEFAFQELRATCYM
jgi:hypothetical protein